MQIIQLALDDWNVFCPLTGQRVFHDDGQPNAPTFRGGWCHEVPDSPVNLAEELQPLWERYLADQGGAFSLGDI